MEIFPGIPQNILKHNFFYSSINHAKMTLDLNNSISFLLLLWTHCLHNIADVYSCVKDLQDTLVPT